MGFPTVPYLGQFVETLNNYLNIVNVTTGVNYVVIYNSYKPITNNATGVAVGVSFESSETISTSNELQQNATNPLQYDEVDSTTCKEIIKIWVVSADYKKGIAAKNQILGFLASSMLDGFILNYGARITRKSNWSDASYKDATQIIYRFETEIDMFVIYATVISAVSTIKSTEFTIYGDGNTYPLSSANRTFQVSTSVSTLKQE